MDRRTFLAAATAAAVAQDFIPILSFAHTALGH